MHFLKKLIHNITGSKPQETYESKYLPDKEIPVDELFTFNFKKNGGKFLYCENETELEDNFLNILQENDWFEKEALSFEKDLLPYLSDNNLIYKDVRNPSFILCSCEGLVAEDGSILFSSKQFLHYKSNELPKDMIIFGKTSQIIKTKSDGLRNIKFKYAGNIPTNISTLQCFKENVDENFLQYGIPTKNLYLLLLEDL